MGMLEEQRATGTVQYIIAPHSPLLMAFPGADLLHFSYRGLHRTTLDLTPHFRIYRDFCREPQAFLEAQLARIAAERAQAMSGIAKPPAPPPPLPQPRPTPANPRAPP